MPQAVDVRHIGLNRHAPSAEESQNLIVPRCAPQAARQPPTRRPRARQIGRQQGGRELAAPAAQGAHALEPGDPVLRIIALRGTGQRFESRNRPAAIDDQQRRAALHAVDERAELVLQL